MNKDLLIIEWTDPSALDGQDFLPRSWFDGSEKREVTHAVVVAGERSCLARCDVHMVGDVATLDYSAYKAFNNAHEIELGKAVITFHHGASRKIRCVDWHSIDGQRIEDCARQLDQSQCGLLQRTYVPGASRKLRRVATVSTRPGSQMFARSVFVAYEGRCAITGCDVRQVLEAAHIDPYGGKHTDSVNNGILLRSDLHTLFDRSLIAIHPTSRNI